MLDITESINLIRYLIVLRPRHTLVKVPECFASDLSTVLGRTIAAQLPTREAHEWERTRQLWEAHFLHRNQGKGAKLIEESPLITIPPAPWPVETVFFPYPVKQDYGQDEPILWELKLLGEAADHGFFLERILSALETISTQPPMNMQLESKGLWGRYQIHAIYAARGATWEPFVEASELNLDYFPTPGQWREGLELGAREDYTRPRRLLVWLSPFDLGPEPYVYPKHGRRKRNIAKRNLPTIEGILRALMARVAEIMPGKNVTTEDAWALVPKADQEELWDALNTLQQRPHHQNARIEPPPKGCMGRWIGTQKFTTQIPEVLLPYLELASILHVGHHTHFGCGTFILR